jgi:outer membrane protein
MNRFLNEIYMKPYLILSFSILLTLPILTAAQEALGLEEAVDMGLKNNFNILVSRNNSAISQANITYGNAGFLPVVSAYGSMDKAFYNAHVKVATGSELINKDAEASLISAGIKAEWVLFDGMGMFARHEKLKIISKITDLETTLNLERVTGEIILAYCNIIKQQKLAEACRQRLLLSNYRLAIARSKYEAGMGSEQEWLQAGVARQSDSTGWGKQDAELQKAKVRLNRLMATDLQKNFKVGDSIPLVQLPSVDELIAQGLEQNTLLKIKSEAVKDGNNKVKQLQSEQYPRLAFMGSWGFNETNTQASYIQYNRYFGPQVGINLGMKLFDGMKLNRAIENARIEVLNRELGLKDQEQEISAMILENYLDYRSRIQSLFLGKEGLALAQKNLDIAMKAYEAGALSSLQLRVAQDDLYRASSELVEAQFAAKTMEVKLLMVCGMLVGD